MTDFIKNHESNARTYANVFSNTIISGSGSKIWDANGKEYIDCLACAGALPLGHNHKIIVERIRKFLDSGQIHQSLDIPTPEKREFLKAIKRALPKKFSERMKIQFCGPSGSDAVEATLKLFKTATGGRSVIAFQGAYHGQTLGALSLMGNTNPKNKITGFSAETILLPYPNDARCPWGLSGDDAVTVSLKSIESMLADPESGVTKPAMMILEAVQGEGGCIPAPRTWLRGLRKITEQYDIPLVIDEIQTGFGGTGDIFAFQHADIIPDAVIMSKALGGGFPAAVVAYDKKYDTWTSGAHSGTFRGNLIAYVAGAEFINHLIDTGLLDEVREKGIYLLQKLQELRIRHSCIGDIRGRGLMIGMEVIDSHSPKDSLGSHALDGKLASEIKKKCYEKGLLIENGGRHGAVLRFLPALTIEKQEIDQAIHILESVIKDI